MKLTNLNLLPDPIVQAISNDPYPVGGTGWISVTTMIGPPQIRMLRRKHWHYIEEDASERIWALLGQAIHTILDRAEKHELTELRLFGTFAGKRISGALDHLILKNGLLSDYKLTSAWSALDEPKPEWIAQLNCLAELVIRNGGNVEKLEVVAIYRDWAKSKALAGGDYPPAAVQRIPIPLWPTEQRVAYIEGRIRLHEAAEAGQIAPCSPEERWAKPEAFAVMKEGRKSALRVLGTPEEAEAWRLENVGAKDFSKTRITKRPGQNVRCESYCQVRVFCPQAKELGVGDGRDLASAGATDSSSAEAADPGLFS